MYHMHGHHKDKKQKDQKVNQCTVLSRFTEYKFDKN